MRATKDTRAKWHDALLLGFVGMVVAVAVAAFQDAPGYMDAMHGLCLTCHQEQAKAEPVKLGEAFGECTTCHRELDGTVLRRLAPYQPRTGGGQQTD